MSIVLTQQVRYLFERQLRPLAENLRKAIVAGTSISHTIQDYIAIGADQIVVDPNTGALAVHPNADATVILDDGRANPDGLQQVTLGEYVLMLNVLMSILQQVESTEGLMGAIERLTPNKAAGPGN